MVWLNALARHLQPQAIQAREGAQVRAIKDSIGHVEVFQMDGVGTPIIGRPRPLPGHDTPNPAHNTYTLKCEDSDMDTIDELINAAQTFYDDARANENGRSRSWEHCYRVFRDARTDPSPDYDYLSLHLAFYLASWGMYRGSSFLLQKDYKVHTPIVEEILKPENDCLFGLACADLRESEVQMMLKTVYDNIANYFRPMRDEAAEREVASPVSPILITKILMGTLGCVPAYDRFFQDGVATYKVTTREYSLESVLRLVDFYEAHNDRLKEAWRGMRSDDLIYPQMKLLDMGFWQIGLEKS